MKSIFQILFLLYFVFHSTIGKPAETNIQPASGTSRTRLALDTLGAIGNAQKAAVSGTKVLSGGVDVLEEVFVENTNSIVGHGKNAIETDTQAVSNSLKTAADAGGQFANSAATIVLSLPKFLIATANSFMGGDAE